MTKRMRIKRFIYPFVLILVILTLNLSMVHAIKNNPDPYISVGILILLLAWIVFKNRTFRFNQRHRIISAVALVGVALTTLLLEVALAYAIAGLGLLVITQVRIMRKSKPVWLVMGGNPLHKLEGDDAMYASIGLSMLASVGVTFFLKVLWLANTI